MKVPASYANLVTKADFVEHSTAINENATIVHGVRTVTAAYTLVADDAGQVIEVDSTTAVTITVPASVLPVRAMVEIVQIGTGQVTVAAGAGATIVTPASLTTRARYSSIGVRARSATAFIASGDLT